MFCAKCGAKIDDNARFCGKCGSPVPASQGGGQAAGGADALSGSGYTSQNGNAPSTASGGKKPGKVPLAALLILSIAVAACAGFFGYRAAHKENADVQEAEKENAGAEELQPNAEEEGQADIDAEEQTDREAELTAALESISYYGDKSKCSMTAEQAAAYGQLIADGLAGDFSFRGGYDESCFTITSWNSPFQIFDSDMGEQVEADRFHAMLCDFSGDGVPYLYVYSSTNDTGEQSFEIYGWTGQKAELIFDTDAEKSYRNNFYIYEDENNKYEIRMDYEEYCPPALFYRVQTYAFAEGTIKTICGRTEENNFEDELWHVIENGVETVYTSEEYSTLTAGRSQTENHKHTLPYTCFHAIQPSTLQEMMEGLNQYAALWGGESTKQSGAQPVDDMGDNIAAAKDAMLEQYRQFLQGNLTAEYEGSQMTMNELCELYESYEGDQGQSTGRFALTDFDMDKLPELQIFIHTPYYTYMNTLYSTEEGLKIRDIPGSASASGGTVMLYTTGLLQFGYGMSAERHEECFETIQGERLAYFAYIYEEFFGEEIDSAVEYQKEQGRQEGYEEVFVSYGSEAYDAPSRVEYDRMISDFAAEHGGKEVQFYSQEEILNLL